jgi:hypothetical protein
MSQTLDLAGGNYVTTKAGFAAGTTTTTTTANTTLFSLLGKAFSAAAASNVATPTTDFLTGLAFRAVAPNFGSIFAFCRDSGGAIRVIQGDIKALDASGGFIDAPQFPPLPDTVAAYAYLVVKAGATASSWTMGASNMAGATGVTYSFTDVMTLPVRPQVA